MFLPRLLGLDRSSTHLQPPAWWTSRSVLLFIAVGNGPVRAAALLRALERQELFSGRTAGLPDGYSLFLTSQLHPVPSSDPSLTDPFFILTSLETTMILVCSFRCSVFILASDVGCDFKACPPALLSCTTL